MSSRFRILRTSNTYCLSCAFDAPESTTNSLSSGLIFDGAGRHRSSAGEKKVDLSFSFSIRIFFGQPPRCFTSTLLLPFRLLLRPVPIFSRVRVSLMRITWENYSKRWFLVSNVGVPQHGCGELNTSYWLQYV